MFVPAADGSRPRAPDAERLILSDRKSASAWPACIAQISREGKRQHYLNYLNLHLIDIMSTEYLKKIVHGNFTQRSFHYCESYGQNCFNLHDMIRINA